MKIALALTTVLLIVIFSVQNAASVRISFLLWKFDASLAIVIFLCTVGGIIVGMTATSFIKLKSKKNT